MKNEKIRLVLAYALSMAAFLFLLQWLRLGLLMREGALEAYVGSIAVLFLFFGAWLARKLTSPSVEKIIVEREIIRAAPVERDEKALEKLGLSPREREVLEALARGLSNAEIASELCLSLSTVKTHASNLFSKMGVRSRAQALEMARRLRLVG